MNILEFIYNESTISFNPTGNDDVMVNATEMANAFGKLPKDFLKAEKTRDFLEVFEINEGDKAGNPVLFDPENDEKNEVQKDVRPFEKEILVSENILKVVKGGRNSGTWMHRILALKFAAWLDPHFEYWVWKTIDTIILGHYREVKAATYEKLEAERLYEEEKTQLMAKYPELGNLLVKQGLITEAEKKRAKALKAATDQLKFEFGNKKDRE